VSNTNKIISSPKNILKDDKMVSLDENYLTIEEKLDEDELILDGIKFKRIEEIVKDPIL
jgi:hypothetical protein